MHKMWSNCLIHQIGFVYIVYTMGEQKKTSSFVMWPVTVYMVTVYMVTVYMVTVYIDRCKRKQENDIENTCKVSSENTWFYENVDIINCRSDQI